MEENTSNAEKSEIKRKNKWLELRMKEVKLKELELKLEKAEEKKNAELANQNDLYGTVAEPRKSLSTYLRNQNKMEVSLVSIMDRKAAILIRITTSLVSAIVVFHNYIEVNVENGMIISIVLIIGMTTSLILSILAAKPFGRIIFRIFNKEIMPSHPNLEENNFMILQDCTLAEYEESMRKVVQSQNLQLGNQIRASYMISKYNAYKGRLVDLAYSVFLITFVLVAAVFLFSRIFN